MRCLAVAGMALLAGCATTPDRPEKTVRRAIWPQPPDQPRFAYEAVLRSAADVGAGGQDQLWRDLTGMSTTADTPVFEKPAAVVARNGNIYVSDTRTRSVVVFDVPRRKVFRFGLREPGTLKQPTGMALDSEMNVYVADSKRRQVVMYDRLGLYLNAFGGPADLERPTGVAVSPDGERIYVIDRSDNESSRHCVVVFDKEGKKLKVIGARGSASGEFNVPLQGAVGPDGTLYVLDSGNFRVQAFDRDGNFLRAFGKPGINPGNLARPRGLAVDGEGNVYVTDASFNNFQIFTPDGQLLLAVGEAARSSSPGHYGLLSGIAVDETGRVYVVDQLFNKVEVIRRLSDAEGSRMLATAS